MQGLQKAARENIGYFCSSFIDNTDMTHAEQLIEKVKTLLKENDSPSPEKFERYVKHFLDDCPNDEILENAKVSWDNENKEFDFRWDTPHLDCKFSIGLEMVTWQVWVGINNHSKDDECYTHGIGGYDIENDDFFTGYFYEPMESNIIKRGYK